MSNVGWVLAGWSLFSFCYWVIVLVNAARWDRRDVHPNYSVTQATETWFIVPALNEEVVIGKSVEALLTIPNSVVLVVDDGSDDETGTILGSLQSVTPRLRVLTRSGVNSRKGKGAALNAAYLTVLADVNTRQVNPDSVLVTIVDADGRYDRDGHRAVVDLFNADQGLGGVQSQVKIRNNQSFLGAMQDIEFLVFTRFFGSARSVAGGAGLGGNGQTTRLSTLQSVTGVNGPWTDCLVEDADLGIRALVAGWEIVVARTSEVNQQGLVSLRKLVRQRTRWVQGTFQYWRRIPTVWKSDIKLVTKLDITYQLMYPAVSALMILLTTPYVLSGFNMNSFGVMVGVGIMLTVVTVGTYLRVNGRHQTSLVGLLAATWVWPYIWFAATCVAVGRMITRKRSWSKTERTTETHPEKNV